MNFYRNVGFVVNFDRDVRFVVNFDRDVGFVVKAFCLDEGQQLATYAATKSGSGDMISDYYLNFLLFIRALLDMSLKTN